MSQPITLEFQRLVVNFLVVRICIGLRTVIAFLRDGDTDTAQFALDRLCLFISDSAFTYPEYDCPFIHEVVSSFSDVSSFNVSGDEIIESIQSVIDFAQKFIFLLDIAEQDDKPTSNLNWAGQDDVPKLSDVVIYHSDFEEDVSKAELTFVAEQLMPVYYFYLKCFRESDNFSIYTAVFPTKLAAYDGFDVCTKTACDMSITGTYRWQVFNEGEEILRELWSDSVPIRVSGEIIDFLPCHALD